MNELVTAGALWRQVLLAGLVVGGTVALCGPARAQIDANRLSRPQVLQDTSKETKVPPPPALPGSKPAGQEPAPPDRMAADMEPNDALFDAINRGDLAAAKDALNRGADLEARNVLGLSPLDLSVDLGHNDISFLLLSMRGGGTSGRRPPAAAVAAKSPPAPAPARSAGRAQAARQAAPAPAAPERPQLFAGSGGTPVPQAGFLGFNNGRAQ